MMIQNQKPYYLLGMYQNGFYPTFLVDKIKESMLEVTRTIEEEHPSNAEIQRMLDKMTSDINALQDEFKAHNSDIEFVARESIAETVESFLDHYGINIDIETALRKRSW